MIHAFSPAGFSLTHHHSEVHLKLDKNGDTPVLNAEDFCVALVIAAQKYFAEVRADVGLQALLIARLEDRKDGGTIGIGRIQLMP